MKVATAARVTEKKCVCKMAPGDAWAVRQCDILVGYYLACPYCGMTNILLADEVKFEERGRIPNLILDFSPGHACTRCRRRFRLIGGQFEELYS